jgi:hypothetical protein
MCVPVRVRVPKRRTSCEAASSATRSRVARGGGGTAREENLLASWTQGAQFCVLLLYQLSQANSVEGSRGWHIGPDCRHHGLIESSGGSPPKKT